MSDNPQVEAYDLDSMPDDVDDFLSTGKSKEFAPLEDDTYQVQITEAKLQQNKFWKSPTEEERKQGKGFDKYVFSFTFVILTEGEFRGRRIWDNAGLSFKPTTKRGQAGPTKLYKIISKAMKIEFDWDEVTAFAPDSRTLYRNILQEVVGRQIRVTVENTKNVETGKTKTKVVSYSSAKTDLMPYSPDEKGGEQPPHPAESSRLKVNDQVGGADDLADDIPF